MEARRLFPLAILVAVTLCLLGWRHLHLPVCFGFVTGTSMVPSLLPGDFVVGVRGKPAAGDVVVFESPNGRLVVHRVVRVGDGWVLTKGDNCEIPDDPVPPERVLCVVVFTVNGAAVVALLGALIVATYETLRGRGARVRT